MLRKRGAPDAFLPEFLYPLNLLLWSGSFHWLDHQIRKDNPEAERDASTGFPIRAVMYAGFILSMGLAFVKPILSIYVIVFLMITCFVFAFISSKKAGRTKAD